MTTRRLSTTFLAFLATLLMTAALGLVLAGPAQAHSELVSSTPSDGGTTSEIPDQIVLEFNEDIQAIGTEVVVVDPEGTPVAVGEPVIAGPVVTQPIGVGAAGVYTVTWRAVSADGHPISGEFSYELVAPTTVDTTSAAETSAAETTTTAVVPPPPSSTAATPEEEETSSSDFAAPVIIGVLAIVVAGAVVLIVRRNRAR